MSTGVDTLPRWTSSHSFSGCWGQHDCKIQNPFGTTRLKLMEWRAEEIKVKILKSGPLNTVGNSRAGSFDPWFDRQFGSKTQALDLQTWFQGQILGIV